MSTRGRICLHAQYLYPVFSSGRVAFAGGAETQQAAIARGLAARGFDVSVVTCDYGQPAVEATDGVTLIRSFDPSKGLPVVRFFHPRLTRTVSALHRAEADVYYARASGLSAGITHDIARLRGASFAYHVAHDKDVDPALPLQRNVRDRWWFRRALVGADRVIAQTQVQRRLLAEGFERESLVVPNLVELPRVTVDPGQDGAVVWLGTYRASKRPERFVALARALPGVRFVMAGVVPPPPLTPELFDAIRETARDLPNLEVHGHVDHGRIGDLLARASLFVHTSPAEGFPNTLLEAWAHGVPALAAVNPDGVIEQQDIGAVVDGVRPLAAAVSEWMDAPARRREAGARARAYVAGHHAPDVVLDALATMFDALVADARRTG